jgi:hypothetical protein
MATAMKGVAMRGSDVASRTSQLGQIRPSREAADDGRFVHKSLMDAVIYRGDLDVTSCGHQGFALRQWPTSQM